MKYKTYELVSISLFSMLIALFSILTIPTTVPITLQTFAIFLNLFVLGGKKGTLSILIYILLGLTGLPIFSGLRGGVGVLLGATGGYVIGFIFMGIFYAILTKIFGKGKFIKIIAGLIGLVICYIFGTVWFFIVYTGSGDINFLGIIKICVIPFIIPDTLKLLFAFLVSERVKPLYEKLNKRVKN